MFKEYRNMEDEFKVLSDRNHCLLRPGTYIGSTSSESISGIVDYKFQTKNIVPGLIKCIEEVFQNSVDEYIRTSGKFANNIEISFFDTLYGTEITISDDGRGIPQELINGIPRPVLAFTSLRSGSNFDDNNRIGAGQNGMGVCLVAIFSKSFIASTSNGKSKITVTCYNNMEEIKHKTVASTDCGTTIKFIPDLTRFGLNELTQDHIDIIEDRFNNLAILYPLIQFSFNGNKIIFKNIKTLAKKFHTDAIYCEIDKASFVFAPTGKDEDFKFLSYINGIHIKNGGTHIDYIMGKISDQIRILVKKKYKIDILPNQVKQHILFASWITGFPALRFDSQSKVMLVNSISEVSTYLKEIDFEKIAKQIINTPSIVDPMIASILFKKQMADAREVDAAKKKVSKKLIVNHIAATDPNPENRSLLLCEGASAIGSLISVRNPKTTGGYPLKGKPLNVRGLKPSEIMKNVEISELLHIIGLEIGKDAINLNYGKIVVFSDLDLDGNHVHCLLLNLFSLWPRLFQEKRIYRLLAPLYYCTKGNKTKIFYTSEEFDSFNSTGWDSQYFKGLGSMPEEVYSECVNNPVLEQIILDDPKKLEMAFGEDASLRKNWMIA
jgi:DNA gyrase/topoisomerase IV subunit B